MTYYQHSKPYKGYVTEVHIADIHFGCIDPETEYNILMEQFINKIALIDFDILSIDGDLFDKKFLANSQAVYYAIQFMNECVSLCIQKNATLILISGTESHDAGQLKLFHHYANMENLDIRFVENVHMEYVQGLKILCIPELYGKGEEYYKFFLEDEYDTAFIHGTIQGSVYGAVREDLNSPKYPVFSIDSFAGCRGPIICGHVHKAMCLNGYIYYCSNPIRYKFGEEEDKGFCIVLHDKINGYHHLEFMPIESFRYDTIDIRTLEYQDPKAVFNYLDTVLLNGKDHIRIDFAGLNDPATQKIFEQYYANNQFVNIKRYVDKEGPKINTTEEIQSKYSDLDFLLDPTMDSYTKFVKFINHNMGSQYITVERLKAVLAGGL